MELLQLHYFKELAEREHVTQTAQALLVSPPALSVTISRLEKELGVSLFDRVGRNIRINDNGRIFLRHVNDILTSLQNAKMELMDQASINEKKVKLGITALSLWLDPIQIFLKRNPDISISHTIVKIDDLKDQSIVTNLDFIITAVSDMPGADWLHETLIYEDKPVVVVYPNHPLAQKGEIDLIEARNEPFVALTKGYSSRKYFDDMCEAAGFTPKIVVECDYLLRSQLVAAEYGITFSTELGAKTAILGEFSFVKVRTPILRREQAILWNKNRYMTVAAQAFKDFMVQYHKEQH